MPSLAVASQIAAVTRPLALGTASGADGPTSAAVGLPIILVLVAVIVIGGILYAVLRKR